MNARLLATVNNSARVDEFREIVQQEGHVQQSKVWPFGAPARCRSHRTCFRSVWHLLTWGAWHRLVGSCLFHLLQGTLGHDLGSENISHLEVPCLHPGEVRYDIGLLDAHEP